MNHRLAAIVLATLLPPAASAVPSALQHQGRLLDADGLAINEPVELDVTLWSDQTNGVQLWTATTLVTPQDGYYSVVLGTGSMPAIDSSVFSTPEAWLQIDLPGATTSTRTLVTAVPFALAAERLADEVVEVTDARLAWSSPVVALGGTCEDDAWCNYGENWGVNRLSTTGVYTACSDWDCSDNYVDVVLDDNAYKSVMLAHLDWSNSGAFDVLLSFDGGATYSFHKRVPTFRKTNDQPYTSQVRTLATNLPTGDGVDVRVRVQGAYKRIHIDGFSLSRNIYPESIDGSACPVGMVGVTGFCIQRETTAAFGQSWTAANDHCTANHMRLCGHEEMMAGIRHGAVETYDYAVRDAWFVTADMSETSPGQSGYNQTCDIQGNPDQSGHPLYSVQCNHDMQLTSAWRTTVCCW